MCNKHGQIPELTIKHSKNLKYRVLTITVYLDIKKFCEKMSVLTPRGWTPGSLCSNSWLHMPTGSGICSFPGKEILTTVCLSLVRTCRSFLSLDPHSKSVFHMAGTEGGLNEAHIYTDVSFSESPPP